jgi:hypothetical protein
MYTRILFALFIAVSFNAFLFAQVDLKKIVPLSPNAAAITKYGEMPVGSFTGIPPINIPLYTIEAKDISLPITLSYHAGGNRVETVASWVGLGWSLNAVPSISRNIRGIPDDAPGGYFFEYLGTKKVKELYDGQYGTVQQQNDWANFLRAVQRGDADTEPDIFSYNIEGRSGKFFYDQETEQFFTFPRENFKISFTTGGTNSAAFTIITNSGNKYVFSELEKNHSWSFADPFNVKITTTSWYPSKIINANKTDSIEFQYGQEAQLFSHINSVTRYFQSYRFDCLGQPQLDYQSDNTGNQNDALLPTQITFSGGTINFIRQSSGRQDLSVGYALDTLKIFNTNQQPVAQYAFKYSYIAAGPAIHNKWLMLDSLYQVSSTGEKLIHHFDYERNIYPPSRTSPAQDFWGFYNGRLSNTDLVPTSWVSIGQPNPARLPGANRFVDTNYSQFGIIKKIHYPTGGYTEYEFENNRANDTLLPGKYFMEAAAIEGEETITTNFYNDTFSVNNPPEYYLNNNHSNGGAFLNIYAGNFGCDLSGGSGPCANVVIRGITPGNTIWMPITGNISNVYLPNGTYVMEASFNQDPPNYQGFYLVASWESLDEAASINRWVGGLRVKKIKNHDAVSTQNDMVRKFRYTTSINSDTTSGCVFGTKLFQFVDYVETKEWWIDDFEQTHICECGYQQFKSYSNIQAVSHSGSFTGYKTVITEYDEQNTEGITIQRFMSTPDIIDNGFPYAPTESNEHLRGIPIETVEYRKSGNQYYPVKRNKWEYAVANINDLAYGVKTASRVVKYTYPPSLEFQAEILRPLPEHELYQDLSALTHLTKITEKVYDQADTLKSIETATNYTYSPSHYQLTQSSFLNSAGETINNKTYYPADVSLSGAAETARQSLISQNKVSVPLKSERYHNSTLIEEIKTNYRHFTSNIVEPEEVFRKIGSGSSVSKIRFNKYSPQNNLVEQQKTDDVLSSYIWDYNNAYPVAECINTDSASVAYTSFEADGKGGWTFSGVTSIHPAALTGLKGYGLSGGSISKSGLLSGKSYFVTYWKRDSAGSVSVNGGGGTNLLTRNGWVLYSHTISGVTSLTISGTAYIDELRLYPGGAMMKTYTYTPLVGVISECDANNRITYYEYDDFNRLRRIKDQDKNVIKVVDYQYKKPQTQ